MLFTKDCILTCRGIMEAHKNFLNELTLYTNGADSKLNTVKWKFSGNCSFWKFAQQVNHFANNSFPQLTSSSEEKTKLVTASNRLRDLKLNPFDPLSTPVTQLKKHRA